MLVPDTKWIPLIEKITSGKNKKFLEISQLQRRTFVGHRLGTHFDDLQIDFSSANFKKIEEILKKSLDYDTKFERIKYAIENNKDISTDQNLDDFSIRAQYFINLLRLEKEKKEYEEQKNELENNESVAEQEENYVSSENKRKREGDDIDDEIARKKRRGHD